MPSKTKKNPAEAGFNVFIDSCNYALANTGNLIVASAKAPNNTVL